MTDNDSTIPVRAFNRRIANSVDLVQESLAPRSTEIEAERAIYARAYAIVQDFERQKNEAVLKVLPEVERLVRQGKVPIDWQARYRRIAQDASKECGYTVMLSDVIRYLGK